MSSVEVADLTALLTDVLRLPRERTLARDSKLLGHIPELDSMAVVALLAEIETRFGVTFADDEVDAAHFETVGSLYDIISAKLAA